MGRVGQERQWATAMVARFQDSTVGRSLNRVQRPVLTGATTEMDQKEAIHPINSLPCTDQVVVAPVLRPGAVQVPIRAFVHIRYFRSGTFSLAHRGMGVGRVVNEQEYGTHIARRWVQGVVAVLATSLACYGRMADAMVLGDSIALVPD